jgi:hypothetical protein
MKHLPARLLVLLVLGLLLGGCSSYDTETPHGRGLAGLKQFFVLSNSNDNHAVDQRIVAALRARGLTADCGPTTMMPDNTQAVVTYQDHWTWDFGEHLYALKFSVRGPDSSETLAAASFYARVPLNEDLSDTVNKLVAGLFSGKNTLPPATSVPTDPDQGTTGKRRSH